MRWSLPRVMCSSALPSSADGADGFPLAQRRAFLQVQRFFLRRDTGQQRLPAGQRRQHQGTVVGNELIGQPLDVHRVLLPQLGQTVPAPRRHPVRAMASEMRNR